MKHVADTQAPGALRGAYRKLPIPEGLREGISFVRRKLKYPGSFTFIDTPRAVQWYWAASYVLRCKTFVGRALAARRVPRPANLPRIRREDGYAIWQSKDLPVDAVRADVQKILSKIDLAQEVAAAKKPFLLSLPIQDQLRPDSSIMRLALHPHLLGAVSEYVGMVPVLRTIRLWYSPNNHMEGRSQLFHMDGEDYRQIKAFVFLDEVTADSGPLTIIPADVSSRVFYDLKRKGLIYRRNHKLADAMIEGATSPDEIRPLLGDPGTIALVDTCRCYHYGSRPGSRPRLVLMIHYTSPFARDLPWRWKSATDRLPFRTLATSTTPPLERSLYGA